MTNGDFGCAIGMESNEASVDSKDSVKKNMVHRTRTSQEKLAANAPSISMWVKCQEAKRRPFKNDASLVELDPVVTQSAARRQTRYEGREQRRHW